MIAGAICLAAAIFFEARSEPTDGQYAVAEVVMNRVADPRWPDTVCGVVNQSRQFSFTHDGLSDDPTSALEPAAHAKAKAIAKDVLSGARPLGMTSNHYHTIAVSPSWPAMTLDGQIGVHIFYTR